MKSMLCQKQLSFGKGVLKSNYIKIFALALYSIFFFNSASSQQDNIASLNLKSQLIGISTQNLSHGKQLSKFQFDSVQTPSRNRVWIVGIVNVVGYGTSLIILNNAWYK